MKITVSPNYAEPASELWIILHNLNGKPIESEKVAPGQTLTLKLDDSQRYHLTTYLLEEVAGNRYESLETYANISVLEDLTLGLQEISTPAPEIDGYFDVNIAGPEYPFGAYLTNKLGSYNSQASQVGAQIQMRMPHVSGMEEHLLVAQNHLGESRYKFFSMPSSGETLTYTFAELSAFDQVLKFSKGNFSQFNFAAVALTESADNLEPGYIVSNNRVGGTMHFEPLNSYEIGFLTRFEKYRIYIEGKRSQNSKTSFAYERTGTIPSSINLPQDQEIRVQKDDALDFQLSLPTGSTNWSANWLQSELMPDNTIRAFRRIIKGSESGLYLELPQDLTEQRLQLLDLSKLQLKSVRITTNTSTYDQQVRNGLVEIPKKQEMEAVTVIQSF